MEIEQKFSDADQAIIDQHHKIIAHHSELLIREILKGSPNGVWDIDCERLYREDKVRDLLLQRLVDDHRFMVPTLIIKF